jgi:hypothetical protein
MECEFDSTDMEGNPFIEWQYKSGIRTYRSVKWCLILPNHHFRSCGSQSIASILVIIFSYEVLIKNPNKNDNTKIQTKHKPHIFLNKQRCWQNYV